ncbi:MAG: hypothetical protein Q7S50_04415 [bacterium]|nr:hypothetical protein [bacterium]
MTHRPRVYPLLILLGFLLFVLFLISFAPTIGGRMSSSQSAAAVVVPVILGAQAWPTPSMFMDVDFANNRAYLNGPTTIGALGIKTQRASSAWIDNTAGVWKKVPPNTLRRSDRGALIEGVRTFVALYNRDLTASVWVRTNMLVTRGIAGVDGIAHSASRIKATANNATVLQKITLPSSVRSQSAFVRRIGTGTGQLFMTMDGGAHWTDITPPNSRWAWKDIPSRTLANPKVGFKVETRGDEFGVDFVLNENGAFKTSPMEVGATPVTREQDHVTMALVPLGAHFPVPNGSVLVKFYSNQDVHSITMLSLHTAKDDDYHRVSFNGNPITAHYGMTAMNGDNNAQGFDPLRPFVKGQHTFVGAMNATGLRAVVALDGSDVRINEHANTWPPILRVAVLGGSYGHGGPICNCYLQEFAFSKNIPSDDMVKQLSSAP